MLYWVPRVHRTHSAHPGVYVQNKRRLGSAKVIAFPEGTYRGGASIDAEILHSINGLEDLEHLTEWSAFICHIVLVRTLEDQQRTPS